ncbi:hypothetical protein SDC9_92259 [bioreactor metagenome]|uniref:Uncharacterized protein n=1 Tax=bioreactor metagenome TaxID=1076179 RepID=A0A645A019_9ZZZZ
MQIALVAVLPYPQEGITDKDQGTRQGNYGSLGKNAHIQVALMTSLQCGIGFFLSSTKPQRSREFRTLPTVLADRKVFPVHRCRIVGCTILELIAFGLGHIGIAAGIDEQVLSMGKKIKMKFVTVSMSSTKCPAMEAKIEILVTDNGIPTLLKNRHPLGEPYAGKPMVLLNSSETQVPHTVKIELGVTKGLQLPIAEEIGSLGNDVPLVNTVAVAHRRFGSIGFLPSHGSPAHLVSFFDDDIVKGKKQALAHQHHIQVVVGDLVVVHRRLFPLHPVIIDLHLNFQSQASERFFAILLTPFTLWQCKAGEEKPMIFQHTPVAHEVVTIPDRVEKGCMLLNGRKERINDLLGDGRTLLEILHRLGPVLHPQACLDRTPSLLTLRISSSYTAHPVTKLGSKGLGVLLITRDGIGLPKADPETHSVEREHPFTVIAGLVHPVNLVLKDHRFKGPFHIPAKIEKKGLVDHIICNLQFLLGLRLFMLAHIRRHPLRIVEEGYPRLGKICCPGHVLPPTSKKPNRP